jgi:hypothetical protein
MVRDTPVSRHLVQRKVHKTLSFKFAQPHVFISNNIQKLLGYIKDKIIFFFHVHVIVHRNKFLYNKTN